MKRALAAVVAMLSLCAIQGAGVVEAQSIQPVAREHTLILENIDGRVPVPDNMNPYVAGQYLEWGMWQATQESLFYYNLESGKLEPWLAERGDVSDGGKTVTITLRSGVKWSDGVPFTADDVVFTIQMLKKNPGLRFSSDMEVWVDSIAAPTPRRVVIKLKRPNPRFLLTYFGVPIWHSLLIAPKHIWQNVDPRTFTNFDLRKGLPLGTGPYRLVRSTETETTFDRLQRWWAADTGFHSMPAPQRVIWIGVGTEDGRAAMGVNNQLDAMWVMSRSTFEIAQHRNPNIIGWTKRLPYGYLDPCPRNLFFNTSAPPFDMANVRLAINDAINRAQLVAVAFEGMSEPSYSVFPTYGSFGDFFDRNAGVLKTIYSEPGKIPALMQAAGYKKNAEGLWAGANGKTVSFTINARSGETDLLKMGPVLVAQLHRAGFDASFRPLETAVYFSDVSNGRASIYLAGTCGSVQDAYASFALFHSRESAPTGQRSVGVTPTRFANSDFDRAVDIMANLPSSDPAFKAAADEALALFTRELPAIPLVQARLLTPFNQTYWSNWPTADNDYVQPGHWWVSGDQLIINVKPATR